MIDSTLEDVGIVGSFHISTVRIKCGSMLSKQLDVLLSKGTCLVDSLTALASSLGQLLTLILDFGVETLKDGQDGSLELFCRLVMLVRDAL